MDQKPGYIRERESDIEELRRREAKLQTESDIEELRSILEEEIAEHPEKEAEIAEYQRKYLSPDYLMKRESQLAERRDIFLKKYDLFNPRPKKIRKKSEGISSPGRQCIGNRYLRISSPARPCTGNHYLLPGGGTTNKHTVARHRNWSYAPEPIEYYHRFNRAFAARNFRMKYKFVKGQKFCISPSRISSWMDNCLDSTWVAVHGKESVCMVTRRQDVDMTRVDPFYQRCCTNQQTMRSYATTVISEVECMSYDDDFFPYDGDFSPNDAPFPHCRGMKKPYIVVSMVPDTKKVHEESDHEASIAEYCEGKASDFCMKKMRSGLVFTFDETIQTAISAFQHLCPEEELKAEDIWVTTFQIEDNLVEHMHLDKRREHLAVISGGSSGI